MRFFMSLGKNHYYIMLSDLFGPLNKKWCKFYWFMEVISFIIMTCSFLLAIYFFTKNKPEKAANSVLSGVNMGIIYFLNRMLYTMCVK